MSDCDCIVLSLCLHLSPNRSKVLPANLDLVKAPTQRESDKKLHIPLGIRKFVCFGQDLKSNSSIYLLDFAF